MLGIINGASTRLMNWTFLLWASSTAAMANRWYCARKPGWKVRAVMLCSFGPWGHFYPSSNKTR